MSAEQEEAAAALLRDRAYVRISERLSSAEQAFAVAAGVLERRCRQEGTKLVEVIGDYVLPPLDGEQTRDFQTLHFDFGLPLRPALAQDVARYTALYVPADREARVSAVTTLVPLRPLLAQRPWPPRAELLDRLDAYGRTHGAWDDRLGYTEGSLARIVEAAAGGPPSLPSVKADPGFLCGLEFDSFAGERDFLARHGLELGEVTIEVDLQPGDLLVFDNLALAHGRRGSRAPGELRQRIFGHRRLAPAGQRELRERVLAAFGR